MKSLTSVKSLMTEELSIKSGSAQWNIYIGVGGEGGIL